MHTQFTHKVNEAQTLSKYLTNSIHVDPNIFIPERGPDPVMDNVNCSGTENQLIECGYNPKPNCYNGEAVGVKCKVGGK